MNEFEIAFLEEFGDEAARTIGKMIGVADHHFLYARIFLGLRSARPKTRMLSSGALRQGVIRQVLPTAMIDSLTARRCALSKSTIRLSMIGKLVAIQVVFT